MIYLSESVYFLSGFSTYLTKHRSVVKQKSLKTAANGNDRKQCAIVKAVPILNADGQCLSSHPFDIAMINDIKIYASRLSDPERVIEYHVSRGRNSPLEWLQIQQLKENISDVVQFERTMQIDYCRFCGKDLKDRRVEEVERGDDIPRPENKRPNKEEALASMTDSNSVLIDDNDGRMFYAQNKIQSLKGMIEDCHLRSKIRKQISSIEAEQRQQDKPVLEQLHKQLKYLEKRHFQKPPAPESVVKVNQDQENEADFQPLPNNQEYQVSQIVRLDFSNEKKQQKEGENPNIVSNQLGAQIEAEKMPSSPSFCKGSNRSRSLHSSWSRHKRAQQRNRASLLQPSNSPKSAFWKPQHKDNMRKQRLFDSMQAERNSPIDEKEIEFDDSEIQFSDKQDLMSPSRISESKHLQPKIDQPRESQIAQFTYEKQPENLIKQSHRSPSQQQQNISAADRQTSLSIEKSALENSEVKPSTLGFGPEVDQIISYMRQFDNAALRQEARLSGKTLFVKGFNLRKVTHREVVQYFAELTCRAIEIQERRGHLLVTFASNQEARKALQYSELIPFDGTVIRMCWKRE